MPNGEKILFEGKTFEILNKNYRHGSRNFSVEIARRSPGVRLLILKNSRMLLIKEYRYELNDYDYRLPGGKVFDSLKEYNEKMRNTSSILHYATEAAKKECLEETGLIVKNIKYIITSNAGLTVRWDLFYFVVDDFEQNKTGQALGENEEIYLEWKTFDKVKEMCLNNKIKEYRSVGVILSYLLKNNLI